MGVGIGFFLNVDAKLKRLEEKPFSFDQQFWSELNRQPLVAADEHYARKDVEGE